MDENEISKIIIGAALDVHRAMGPGLLESVYQQCLAHEMKLQGMAFKQEVLLKAEYKGLLFDSSYIMDFVVAEKVVVELKVVESLLPVHEAQLLSYLRLSGYKLGLLINFNVVMLKTGIKRIVNNLHE